MASNTTASLEEQQLATAQKELLDFQKAFQSAETDGLKKYLKPQISKLEEEIIAKQRSSMAEKEKEKEINPAEAGEKKSTGGVLLSQTNTTSPKGISKEKKSLSRMDVFTEIKSYSWDETDTKIKIYVTLPNGGKIVDPKEDCRIFCQPISGGTSNIVGIVSSGHPPNRKCVTFEALLQPKAYALTLQPLKNEIDPESLSIRCKENGASVVLTLTKVKSGKWWDLLDKNQQGLGKSKKEEEGDPGASLMNMMKQMYNEGDDQMKRTIGEGWEKSQKDKASKGMDL